jgi:hypothetical protein
VSLIAALRRARHLSVHDHALLIESLVIALALELALRLTPFARVRRWFGASNRTGSAPTSEVHARLARFAGAAYRVLPLPGTCLRQSLVLCALLKRRDLPGRLCLGVRRRGDTLTWGPPSDGPIQAHAWVECGAGDLVPSSEPRFLELRPHRG